MEFISWGKTPRLRHQQVLYTEKIDGTNACIRIVELNEHRDLYSWGIDPNAIVVSDPNAIIRVQSRKRFITPESDNYGLASWVEENAESLVEDLGPGDHFGEWWGKGIQSGYGLDHKRFSLFNVHRWGPQRGQFFTPSLDVVPLLLDYTLCDEAVDWCLDLLREKGSQAAPGFNKPEGIIAYHRVAERGFKALLENNNLHKWQYQK